LITKLQGADICKPKDLSLIKISGIAKTIFPIAVKIPKEYSG
jgi:hypothetical protein